MNEKKNFRNGNFHGDLEGTEEEDGIEEEEEEEEEEEGRVGGLDDDDDADRSNEGNHEDQHMPPLDKLNRYRNQQPCNHNNTSIPPP